MRPLRGKDPAPSRVSYRLQRLMLTPVFRLVLRFGVPLVTTMVLGFVWLNDAARRDAALAQIAEIRRSVEERPEFMVNVMAVDGATESTAAHIRGAVPIEFPVSSFDLDLEAMRMTIEELAWVERVEVRIQPGGVLQIEVAERMPAVVWRSSNRLEVLDKMGHRLETLAARTDRPELPLIAGDGAERAVPEALRLLEAATPLAGRLAGLVRVGERRWDLVLGTDVRIMLPETESVAALERVITLDQAQDLLARDIVAVDLRNPHRLTLRLRPGAAEKLHLIQETSLGVN